jgi:hypothetical protein
VDLLVRGAGEATLQTSSDICNLLDRVRLAITRNRYYGSGMNQTEERTDRLHTYAAPNQPRVTVSWKTREWSNADRDKLARTLFGPRPDGRSH